MVELLGITMLIYSSAVFRYQAVFLCAENTAVKETGGKYSYPPGPYKAPETETINTLVVKHMVN